MNIEYRQAVGPDASELTGVAFAAKRHWGYPEEWIKLWADELTIEPEYIETHSPTLKVISDPNAASFYRRLGFNLIGDRPARPKGRWLPLLEANVASARL